MKFSYSYIVIFVAIIAASLAGQDKVVHFEVNKVNAFCKLTFKDCGSTLGKVLNVSFNGTCSSQGFAILKKGTSVQIDFQFQSYNTEAVLNSVVHGKISLSPWIPFPFGNPDACKDSGLNCPIPANTTLDYKPVLNVLEDYPAVNVFVKWELQNAKNTDVFCIVLPATITN